MYEVKSIGLRMSLIARVEQFFFIDLSNLEL